MVSATTTDLVARLDRLIEEHHLLHHPFYQAWTAGRLDRESLLLYAAQYYQHVRAFPKHLRRLAERTDGNLRAVVDENLAEELDSRNPHPKLWRDFAAALGVEANALDSAALPGIRALVEVYTELAENGSLPEAVAALYAYEAQVPEIASQKIAGLRRYYGISAPNALAYFAVHEEADVRHRAAWRDWLAQQTDADQRAVLHAAERGLRALWGALDAVHPVGCAAN